MTSSIARPPSDIASLKREAPFVQEQEPSLYLYHLDFDGHGQTGLAACYSLDEYDTNRHQKARADAQGQGRRSDAPHARAARANGSGVPDLPAETRRSTRLPNECGSAAEPLFDFEALDGVRHAIWRVDSSDVAGARAGRSHRSSPSTSLTAITERPARRARATVFVIRSRQATSWRWRFPRTRSGFFRTTASFATSMA